MNTRWVGNENTQPTIHNNPMNPSNPEFKIVQANIKDLSPLRELEKLCFERDAWPLLELIGVLSLPGLVRLKAVMNDTMVGFVGGDAHRDEGVGWITTIGVHPDYRRQGIALALLDACETLLEVPIIKLTVRRSNFSAIVLYTNHGYHQVDVWEKYYNDGEDGLIFEKIRVDEPWGNRRFTNQ